MTEAPDIRILTITDLAFGGDGMAYDGGQLIFVPYAVPGDVVRVKIAGKKDRQIWARILDVMTPSPDRLAQPPCGHCFDCGGCQLQQMRLSAYQTWKYQSVLDRLKKGGLIPETVHPFVAIDPKTRRRATFCAQRVGSNIHIGFNRHHSDQIIDLAECFVVVDEIMAILPGLRRLMDVLMDTVRQTDIAVTLLDTGLDVLITGDIELNLIKHEALAEFSSGGNIARIGIRANERSEVDVVLQPRPARIVVGGVDLDPAPGSFLQPSREGETALISAVVSGVGSAKKVMDLFCGLGTFTFPLAAGGMLVCGVDADGPGIRAAEKAVRNNPRVKFTSRNLYRDPLLVSEFAGFDAVVFDPPRAGAKGQGPKIASSGVSRIVAVSCNPGSFITDCVPFLDAGYRFTDLHVIDQFTWSSHVEIIGVFCREQPV